MFIPLIAVCLVAVSVSGEIATVSVADVGDWVLDETSGRAFATLTSENAVAEFAPSGEVRRWTVSKKPTELMIKSGILVVACTEAPTLHFIDLRTNRATGTVKLVGKGPYALFCSKAADPFAYCICNTGDAWWDGEVIQVDMRTKKVRKQTKVQQWGQSYPVHVAMSPDGKWIIPDARGQSSPSGADLMKVNAEELSFLQIRDYHDSFGQIVAGPMNRYWTLGGDLYSIDIARKIRKYSGTLCAIHPKWDLVASLRDNDALFLQKFSDASGIAQAEIKINVPTRVIKPNDRSRSRSSSSRGKDRTLQFDLKNDRLFVGLENGGAWVELSEYESDLRPLRMINAPSEVSTLVSQPMEIPISMTNPSAQPPARLVIEGGPEGAKVANGKIVWRPGPDDLGIHSLTVKIRTTDGEDLDQSSVTVSVTLPKVELDFHIKSMKLSPDGKRVVAWGPSMGQERRHPAHTGNDGIAVIDTESVSILAAKSIPQGIRDAAINDDFVMIAPASGNLLYRLDHRLGNSRRQFLQSTPSQLRMMSPSVLMVRGEQVEMFEIAEMKSVGRNSNQHHIHNSNQAYVTDTLSWNGRLTETRTGKLLRLTSANLPAPKGQGVMMHSGFGGNQGQIRGWGRQMSYNGMLSSSKGSRIAQPSNVQSAAFSSDWPVGIMVSKITEGRQFKQQLQLCDLIDGTIRQASTLSITSQRTGMNHYGFHNRILNRGKSLYIADDTELLFAELSETLLKSLPVPAHFTDQQKTEILVGGKKQVPIGYRGPKQGVTFSLMREYAGLEIDESTGALTIDTDAIWSQIVSTVLGTNGRSPRFGSRGTINLTENSGRYFDAMDKKLADDQFAGQIPISLSLRDAEGQEDQTQFVLVLVGPKKPLSDALAKMEADRVKQMEEQKKRQEQMRRDQEAARQAAMAARANENESVEQRLQRMEAKMRRLEAALDAVLKKLEEQDGN